MRTCSICMKKFKKDIKMLSPMTCVRKHGSKAHKVCQRCWFTIFSKEDANHECPGCEKKLKLTKPPKSKAPIMVIDLTL